MVELVLASVNDRLLEGELDEADEGALIRFLHSGVNGISLQARYWSQLAEAEDFPVSQRLNALLQGSKVGTP